MKNQPAFPQSTQIANEFHPGYGKDKGMTLRDYFAAKAMQALIHVQVKTKQQQTAAAAYEWADEMLKARET